MRSILFILSGLLCAVAAIGQPDQLSHRDIREHKIRSVTTVSYDTAGNKIYEQTTWLSVKGYDSLKYLNDETGFTFSPETNSEGRLKQLVRKDMTGRIDEVYVYRYDQDSSYSIETIIQGAGTVLISTYNSAGDCVQIIADGDTLICVYNPLGKIQEIKKAQDGSLVTLARTDFDASGYPVASHGLYDDPPVIIRYRNNSLGLPEEIKQYTRTGTVETMEIRTTFSYTFY